jgi:hypothetical protein
MTALAALRRARRRGALLVVAIFVACLGPLAAVVLGHGHTVSLGATQLEPLVGEQVTFTAQGNDGHPGADRYDFDVNGDESVEQSRAELHLLHVLRDDRLA